ncbi:MAG: ECF transporter S component [Coriobacteriales bacterium]|jgi:energy-coupling factor transport system substrate-specific component|nr:ECF transporter S component [Coriobacteriales bacterium]
MKTFLRILEPIALALVPIVLVVCIVFGVKQTALLSALVALLAIFLAFARFEAAAVRARDIMPIVVLAALAVVSRLVFVALPNFMPVSAIVIIAGVSFGRQQGFMVGAIAALVSNMFLGQGHWTPWQMYLWGMMGYGSGALVSAGLLKLRWQVVTYGVLASVVYGIFFDTYHLLAFVHPTSVEMVVSVYLLGIPMTVAHDISTLLFLLLLYAPWSRKITRVKQKYGLA